MTSQRDNSVCVLLEEYRFVASRGADLRRTKSTVVLGFTSANLALLTLAVQNQLNPDLLVYSPLVVWLVVVGVMYMDINLLFIDRYLQSVERRLNRELGEDVARFATDYRAFRTRNNWFRISTFALFAMLVLPYAMVVRVGIVRVDWSESSIVLVSAVYCVVSVALFVAFRSAVRQCRGLAERLCTFDQTEVKTR
jgi:hypothetical protein